MTLEEFKSTLKSAKKIYIRTRISETEDRAFKTTKSEILKMLNNEVWQEIIKSDCIFAHLNGETLIVG